MLFECIPFPTSDKLAASPRGTRLNHIRLERIESPMDCLHVPHDPVPIIEGHCWTFDPLNMAPFTSFDTVLSAGGNDYQLMTETGSGAKFSLDIGADPASALRIVLCNINNFHGGRP